MHIVQSSIQGSNIMRDEMKLPRLPELILVKVSNGYILKEVYSGESAFHEPYEKFINIFNGKEELLGYLEGWIDRLEERNNGK